MTLIAISYNPPTTHSSSKWRKGLALLSSKLHTSTSTTSKRHKNTTNAAATEKILRHNSTQTKTIIKCEDLTAKEFAQMAGIKIKTNEDLIDEQTDLLSSCSSSSSNNNSDILIDNSITYLTTKTTNTFHHNNNNQMTSISTTLSTKSCHQIWESDFWQCGESKNNNNEELCKVNTNMSTITTNTTHTNNNDTLFISQLRSSTKSIQKGRFKIVVGQDDCEPVNQHHHVVLEWKRKRSDSSSASNNNKK